MRCVAVGFRIVCYCILIFALLFFYEILYCFNGIHMRFNEKNNMFHEILLIVIKPQDYLRNTIELWNPNDFFEILLNSIECIQFT